MWCGETGCGSQAQQLLQWWQPSGGHLRAGRPRLEPPKGVWLLRHQGDALEHGVAAEGAGRWVASCCCCGWGGGPPPAVPLSAGKCVSDRSQDSSPACHIQASCAAAAVWPGLGVCHMACSSSWLCGRPSTHVFFPPPTLHTHTINDPCTRPASLDGMLWLALACLGPALAAVVGPTTDGGRLPPFDWSEHKHLASQTQHIGQPSRFDFAFELLTPDDSRWARSGRHAGGPSHSLGKHHRPLEQQQSSADSDAATSAGSLVRTALRWRAVAQRAAGAAAAHSDDAEGS